MWKRVRLTGAMLLIGATVAGSAELEQKANFVGIYRSLSATQTHLSVVERLMFTVLIAATEHFEEHKRQA